MLGVTMIHSINTVLLIILVLLWYHDQCQSLKVKRRIEET